MSKAERIRQLLRNGFSTGEIAARVHCAAAYVRAVRIRSRRGHGKERAYFLALYHSCDRDAVNHATRRAYRAARNAGASVALAERIKLAARKRAIYATGDKSAARTAWHQAQ